MEAKNTKMQSTAIMKIRQQLQRSGNSNATTGKRRRRRTKSASILTTIKQQIENKNKPILSRRQSYPQCQSTSSQSERSSTERSSSTVGVNSAGASRPGVSHVNVNNDTAKTLCAREVKVEILPSGQNKTKQEAPRTTLFVNATELPPLAPGRRSRHSSFRTRKRIDNDLGYRGRKNNRHSWQEERQQEYEDYFSH